ncbi:hypothetical protein BBI10_13190 [Pseudomonas graminis]|uniref:Uncharacterized protein n=1 Tax=Pseudomonas graminis TaxID=158627 RepID=A0A1C2E0G3_9PSED|nr:hypothetical protein BBI10_13190 [Pseudomonas graminis]
MIMVLAAFLVPQSVRLIESRLCQSETAQWRAGDGRRTSNKSVVAWEVWIGLEHLLIHRVEANR